MAELTNLNKLQEPIQLSYVYKGSCDVCSTPIETLEQDLDIDGKQRHFVIAYCMNCRKQIKSKEVKKLENE